MQKYIYIFFSLHIICELPFQNDPHSKAVEDLKQQVTSLQAKLQTVETSCNIRINTLQAKINNLETGK